MLLDTCPDGWELYPTINMNKCFYISTTKASQSAADAACTEMSAKLASITSQAEMDFVKSNS